MRPLLDSNSIAFLNHCHPGRLRGTAPFSGATGSFPPEASQRSQPQQQPERGTTTTTSSKRRATETNLTQNFVGGFFLLFFSGPQFLVFLNYLIFRPWPPDLR